MQLDPNKLSDIFNMQGFEESINKELKDESSSIDINKVYEELTTLVKSGNEIFSTIKIVIEQNPDPEMVTSAANLLSAIRDTLKEFTKIYTSQMRFNQVKDIELMRINSKKDQLQFKFDKMKELVLSKNAPLDSNGAKQITDGQVVQDMVPYCQERIINEIMKAEKSNTSNNLIEEDKKD